ncbi:MAG: DinB family protein [Asgard group archaeon]|nr:DinB family protein [Asgard group archaeon]
MFTLADYYRLIEEDRNEHLELFKLVPEEVFHKNYSEDTWSPELIFRHLISVLNWFKNLVPNAGFEETKLGFEYGTLPDNTVSLEDLVKEFHRISDAIKEGIEKMTDEQQEEILDTGFGKRPRKRAIAGLLNHESNHLGQVIWIFKRATGWTDKKIREKLYGVKK